MLLILPPSETKRDGGIADSSFDARSLSFPELSDARERVAAQLDELAVDLPRMAEALKLGPKQRGELERNQTWRKSPVMAALDRYTGVLYDALGPTSFPEAGSNSGSSSSPRLSIVSAQSAIPAMDFAGKHLAVHSALFGLVGAADLIPAYRLSHNSRLPGTSLKKMWREPLSWVLEGREDLLLDLRSEAYVELGPAPRREGSYFLRLVAEGTDGQKRALNHFNKKGKGEFVRALLLAGIDHPDAHSLIAWANDAGWRLQHGAPGELELEVVNALR